MTAIYSLVDVAKVLFEFLGLLAAIQLNQTVLKIKLIFFTAELRPRKFIDTKMDSFSIQGHLRHRTTSDLGTETSLQNFPEFCSLLL